MGLLPGRFDLRSWPAVRGSNARDGDPMWSSKPSIFSRAALEPDRGPLRHDAREKEDGEKGVRTFHV